MDDHPLAIPEPHRLQARIGSLLRPAVPALPALAVLVLLWRLSLSDGGRHPLTLMLTQLAVFLWVAMLIGVGRLAFPPVTSAMIAMIGALAATTVGSVRPDSSVRELLLWLFYLGILLLTVWSLSTRSSARRFLDGLVVVAGWVALVGFYLFWGAGYPGMRWYSTFYWPNPFAAFLLLVIPVEASRLVHARAVREALGHAAMLLLLGVPFVLTYSRGAWLTLAAVAPLALVLFRPPSRLALVVRPALTAAAVVGLIVVLTRGAALETSPQAVLGRAISVANTSDNSIQGRLNFWRSGLEIFRDHPLLGTGPGTYAYVHAQYQRDVRHFARDAHSLYVQTAAEMGVVGLAALAALLAAIAMLSLRALRSTRATEDYPLVAGIALGLAGFFLHSALDMNWPFPANPAMAFALLGVLASYDRGFSTAGGWVGSGRGQRRLHPWRWGAVVSLLVAGATTYLVWAGQQRFLDGNVYVRSREWAKAAASLRMASRLNPLDPRSPSGLGVVLERLGAEEAEIRRAITRSMALDPNHPYYAIQLAEMLYRRAPSDASHRREAVGLLKHALVLDRYHQPQAYRLLARIYSDGGQVEQAEAVYREARARYGRGWTDDGVLRTMLWPGVSRLYMQWADFLVGQGRPGDAEAVYLEIIGEDARYVPAYVGAANVLIRQRRVDDALALLSRGLERVPESEVLWRRWRSRAVPRGGIWEQ